MKVRSQRIGNFGNDFASGMVVFLVALPLCLGIALASGAPIVSGLLSGIIGGLVVGAISGSHTSVSGPAAGLTAIIAAHISTLGSFEALLAAVVIAGTIQIIMGIARAGFLAAYFPTSVLKGFLAAIGFILVLKQLPHLFGLDNDYEGEMAFLQHDHETTFSALFDILFQVHRGALAVGLMSLIFLVVWNRIPTLKKIKIPAPLIVVILGTIVASLFNEFYEAWSIGQQHRVDVPVFASFDDFSKLFITPSLNLFLRQEVWFAGISLALVASLETLINIEAVDKIDPLQRKSPPNHELVAQGIGNVVLGLIGGLPTTSVIIRSSVNINAGAKSKNSTVIHGLFLLISVVAFPLVLNKIPLSCLAAILIMTGLKLTSPKIFIDMWSQGPQQFLPFAITFLAIVFSDLLTGALIGLLVSLVFILKRHIEWPVRVVLEHHVGGDIRRLVLDNQVSFLNRASLKKTLDQIPSGSRVILDASDTDHIDADVLDILKDFGREVAQVRGISVNSIGFTKKNASLELIQFADHPTPDRQKNATPDQVMLALKRGNLRVRSGQRLRRDLTRQIAATADGQFPLAVVLSCIDSRVPVELIFDVGIGDIFSIRMAGNVISEKVLGSIEFACRIAGAKLIVVMGHTRCGAVSAAFNSYLTGQSVYDEKGCQHLGTILNDIQEVIRANSMRDMLHHKRASMEECEEYIARKNVMQSIERIKAQSNVLSQLIEQHSVGIVGCIYDVANGAVEFLDSETPLLAKKSTADQEYAWTGEL